MDAPRTAPRAALRDTVTVEISIAVIRALRPQAARRDVSVQRLISDVIEVVAADGLVSAVLDDDQSHA
jgi:hypothetical protein